MKESDAKELIDNIRDLIRSEIAYQSIYDPDSMGSYHQKNALKQTLLAIFPEPEKKE